MKFLIKAFRILHLEYHPAQSWNFKIQVIITAETPQ